MQSVQIVALSVGVLFASGTVGGNSYVVMPIRHDTTSSSPSHVHDGFDTQCLLAHSRNETTMPFGFSVGNFIGALEKITGAAYALSDYF